MSDIKQGEKKAPKRDKSQGEYPDYKLKGAGDVYAYAVKSLLDESKGRDKSKHSWLGVEKESLDPKEYAGKNKLKTKGK